MRRRPGPLRPASAGCAGDRRPCLAVRPGDPGRPGSPLRTDHPDVDRLVRPGVDHLGRPGRSDVDRPGSPCRTGPDPTGPDRTGPGRTGPGRCRLDDDVDDGCCATGRLLVGLPGHPTRPLRWPSLRQLPGRAHPGPGCGRRSSRHRRIDRRHRNEPAPDGSRRSWAWARRSPDGQRRAPPKPMTPHGLPWTAEGTGPSTRSPWCSMSSVQLMSCSVRPRRRRSIRCPTWDVPFMTHAPMRAGTARRARWARVVRRRSGSIGASAPPAEGAQEAASRRAARQDGRCEVWCRARR